MRYVFALFAAAVAGAVMSPGAPAAQSSSKLSSSATLSSPAFSSVPELKEGYKLLYEQKFPEARKVFEQWAEKNPTEPFGQVSIAASYLFEEFYRQRVLTSDYFLDDKRFLGGITGTPDAGRMQGFQEAVARARALASQRLKQNKRDPEGLYALTLSAGMQSDADSMLLKKHYDALKHLKEANNSAEILLADHPEAYDIYVAPGIAYYVIGSLSGSARFILWFGGIHGDKDLGMQKVQKTAEDGNYLRPFARILLALSARREKKDELAIKNLKALIDEFPENTVYQTEYAKALGRPIPATIAPVN
jgi:tetratricopeptide (TPR) repeat protein